MPGARITFIPPGEAGAESGSTSYGMTDDQGEYTLEYSSSAGGAVAATHLVRISTFRSGGEDDEGNETPGAPEKVPAEYNAQADANLEMKKEVQPGANTIDFDLTSGGEIVQPAKTNPDAPRTLIHPPAEQRRIWR